MAGFKRFALSPSFSEHKTIISENGKNTDGRGAFPTYSVVRFEVDAPVNTESASMLVLSDGSDLSFRLRKTANRQWVDLGNRLVRSLRLERLVKSDDPSAFPALTQWEVWGRDL